MVRITLMLPIVMLLAGISIHAAELKVSHAGPTPEEYQLKEEQFSTDAGTRSLGYIDKYLTSFGKLTELLETKAHFRDRLPHRGPVENKDNKVYSVKVNLKELYDIGNLDWEVQNLGFHNHYVTLKGTLLLQQARIKELEYELLKARSANEEALQMKQKEATESRRVFQEFTNSQSWVD